MTITVEDSRGAPLAGASGVDATGKPLGSTDDNGRLTFQCSAPCQVRIAAEGFAGTTVLVNAGATVRLESAGRTEQVTVTAYRAPLGSLESPATTRLLSGKDLATTAAVSLDDELRQLPGLELFRRSSALVANPSSQGMSLRALGSTSASRTLITEDDVPLNDAFAGTIHWLEQPELAIKSIELVRGGASDLYGSSAIGGVVNVVPVRPASDGFELRSSFGGENTYDDSLLVQARRGGWGVLASGGTVGTDGYIQEAPTQRGPVDIVSNVHSQNGVVLGEQAMRLCALVFIALRFRSRLRFFPMWQQTLAVLALLLNDRILLLVVRVLSGAPLPPASWWISPFVGALLWPFLFLLLDDLRARLRIQ